MRKILLVGAAIFLSGCSQQRTDEHYWCSYEEDEAAYEHCIETGEQLDEHTAESAGKRVD